MGKVDNRDDLYLVVIVCALRRGRVVRWIGFDRARFCRFGILHGALPPYWARGGGANERKRSMQGATMALSREPQICSGLARHRSHFVSEGIAKMSINGYLVTVPADDRACHAIAIFVHEATIQGYPRWDTCQAATRPSPSHAKFLLHAKVAIFKTNNERERKACVWKGPNHKDASAGLTFPAPFSPLPSVVLIPSLLFAWKERTGGHSRLIFAVHRSTSFSVVPSSAVQASTRRGKKDHLLPDAALFRPRVHRCVSTLQK